MKPVVNHKDGDKYNNFIDNLEWCTSSENFQHALKNGLYKPPTGKRNGRAKIVLDTSNGIFYDYAGEAAVIKGIHPNTLRNMLNGADKNRTSLIYV